MLVKVNISDTVFKITVSAVPLLYDFQNKSTSEMIEQECFGIH